jgi:hypothetical protein
MCHAKLENLGLKVMPYHYRITQMFSIKASGRTSKENGIINYRTIEKYIN